MQKIAISLIMGITFSFSGTTLVKTGQTLSYDEDGVIVTDGSIKDDGYYQAGVDRNYSRNVDIVIDNTTRLEWQDDATSSYMNQSGASGYCTALSLGDHDDWRVPSIQELLTLIDASQYNPSFSSGLFNVISSSSWASTTSADLAGWAWATRTYYGDSNVNFGSAYVRCVRGGSLVASSLTRDAITNIVTDSTTGLHWQDDSAAETMYSNWTDAIDYCENACVLGGYTDWRLPNRNELASIVDYTQFNPALSVFIHVAEFAPPLIPLYWTSTSVAIEKDVAWYIDFYRGQTYYSDESDNTKSSSAYVRCVRTRTYTPLLSSDFTMNGSNDLLWHNVVTGAVKIMEMNSTTPEGNITVVIGSNTNLIPKGIGDFTGDAKPDILFHNQNSGNLRIWEMDGSAKSNNIQVLGSSNTNLKIAGVGDFDNDGDMDIATFNTNSGALRIWVMDGMVRVDNILVLSGANLNLMPRGAGDMDGDGIPDLVLRNNNSGAVRVWTMNNDFTRKGNEYVTGSSNTNLVLRGVVDINGDGDSDILNYNTNTGTLRAWLMDGSMGINENIEIFQDTDLDWSVRN